MPIEDARFEIERGRRSHFDRSVTVRSNGSLIFVFNKNEIGGGGPKSPNRVIAEIEQQNLTADRVAANREACLAAGSWLRANG
jgi:hypothetical protein